MFHVKIDIQRFIWSLGAGDFALGKTTLVKSEDSSPPWRMWLLWNLNEQEFGKTHHNCD